MAQPITLPIQTARLWLRDFTAADLAAVHAYASDPEVTRYMFYGPREVAESQDYIARMLRSQREQPRMTWELAVIRQADHRLIGACDLTLDDERQADLGYILARDVWGQGYAVEAAQAMLQRGFEDLGLERIYAVCDVDNVGSRRVLEKLGLQREVVLARFRHIKGRWWDMLRCATSRAEWEARRADCGDA